MEQFRNALITKYYRNADGIALVYDITRHDSFDSIDNWIKEVKNYCGLDTVKMVLIGNKLDRASDRKVTIEEGRRLADRYGMIFIELSAMDIATLPKLNELFTDLAHRMFSLREQKELTLTSSTIIRLGRDGSISDDWVVVNTQVDLCQDMHILTKMPGLGGIGASAKPFVIAHLIFLCMVLNYTE